MLRCFFFVTVACLLTTLITSCPTDHWIPCTGKAPEKEGGQSYCDIPKKETYGYIAYGGDEIWSRTPFSNYKNEENQIICNEKLAGKLNIPANNIKCCWVPLEIGIDLRHNWNNIDSKETEFDHTNQENYRSPHWVRRGKHGRYTYRVATKSMKCNEDSFGEYYKDTVKAKDKHCGYTPEQPIMGLVSSGSEQNNAVTKYEELWEKCQPNEHKMCSMGESQKNQFVWVKYGDEESFNFREILSKHGKFKCSEELFGSPQRGSAYCYWIKKPNPLIALQPHWELVSYCRGCLEHNLDVSVGVTLNEQTTISLTKEHAISASLGLSLGYMGNSVNPNIGYAGKRSTTQSLRDTTDLARSSTSTFKCGHYRKIDKITGQKKEKQTNKVYPYAYQWVRGIIDYSTFDQITIATVRFPFIYCSQYGIAPICGPNDDGSDACKDGNGPRQETVSALIKNAKGKGKI